MLRLFLMVCMAVGFAVAQDQTPAASGQNPKKEVRLDKQEVHNFTVAFVQIAKLKQMLGPKLETKDGSKVSEELQQSINEKFQSKAQQIIKKSGLTLERYGYYINLLQKSSDFKKLIKGIIAQMSKQPAK